MSWVEVALLGAVIASLVISFVAILVAVGAKFRLTQLEQDQTATELLVSKLKGQVYGVVEGGGLLSRQAEVEQLLDMLIDCQDQVEDELYGDGEGRKGLRQKFEELWNKVYFLEEDRDVLETAMDARSDVDDALCKRVDEVEEEVDRIGVEAKQERNRLDWFVESLRQLEKKVNGTVGWTPPYPQRKPFDLTCTGEPLREKWGEEALQKAGWTVTEDSADLFMSPLRLPSDGEEGPPIGTYYGEHLTAKREERCIDGQCDPTTCDREQCPHRTQELVIQPYTGILSLLDGQSGEWDQVLEQGQVELPAETEAEGR